MYFFVSCSSDGRKLCTSNDVLMSYSRHLVRLIWSSLCKSGHSGGQTKMNVSFSRSRNKEPNLWGKPEGAFTFEHNKIIFVRENSSSH